MKRRLLSAFLAVMMVLTMAPVAFAADDDGVKSYDELVTAIRSASDKDTIKLANDITLTDTLSINKNVTLDGQGHTISGTVPSSKSFISVQIPDDGDFTMTNCVIVPSGNVTPNPAINLSVNGKVSVTNCTFGAKSDTAGYMYNGLEFSQTYAMGDTNITGNTFYGGAFRHNCISFYKMAEKANINISNNDFVDLNWDTTNAIRVSNYSSANATITLNSNIYSTHGSDAGKDYAGLLFFQITNSHNDDLTKLNVVVNGLKTDFDGQLYYTYKDGVGLTSENEAVFHGDDSIAKYFVAKIDDTYYKTLAAAVAAAQSGETVKLLANINGQTVIPADKNIVLDLNGKTMTHTGTTLYNSGTLVVKDSSADKSGKIVSTGNVGIGVNHNSTTTIEYANIQAQEGAVITGYATGATITIEDGVFTALDNAVVAGNGNKTDKNTEGTPERVNANKITINGGTFTGNIQSSGYVACGIYAPWKDNIVVNGGTFNITGGAGIVARGGIVVVNNGEFNTTGNATGKVGDSRVVVPCSALVFDSAAKYPSLTNDSKIQINDGKFKSDVDTIKVVKDDTDMNSRVIVGGGYFTTDPTNYVASGYVAGTSDVSGYSYKVVAKTNTGSVEVKPDVAKPEVKVDKIPQADKEKVAAAAKTVSAPTLGAAAVDEAQKIDKSKADELVAKANKVTGDKKLYVQSALKVEPTAYDETTKTLALEITPQYRVVASTADTADKIKLDGDTKNAQVVQDYQTMNITKATVVTMELPTGFAVADGDKLSIQHTKNGTVEYYTGTVTKKDDKFYLTFTTNGFSPFVISVPAASIGENVYPTLQAAADAAKSTDVISVKSGASHELNFTTTKSVKVKNDTGVAITVKFNGTNKEIDTDKTETFSYTKPSSSSSGGSSSGKTTYKVTTSAVNNGGVNASPSNAEKGATITITLSPNKGYKLDKLTVTDGSGKSVSTVKKSDTVYTFTMPASAVTVGVSYAKADETPSKTTFNDVSANDWFASAVDYVTGKGMMNGTADNTFSPKANTTRGMVVTVLYRLENQPSTSAASFTDVASGAYYANAVAWANANGIVSGYGSGKFGPNDKVTREQLAAILYRYAQYKKYDVSGANSLDGYADAQSVSSYAVPALQWANAAGVVTGKSGSKLDPKGNAARAEVAAMLMRFCENVK